MLRLFSKRINKWFLTSIDTDQWMNISMAMSTGRILSNGEAVQVTVQRIANGGPKNILDRVFDTITDPMDEGEPAWPPAGQYHWLTPSVKVAFFVLV